jgi:hypothetical protein
MSKRKTSVSDFIDIMDGEVNEAAAFAPQTNYKQSTKGIGPTEINPFILEMTQVEESAPKALAEREQTVSKPLAEMSTKKESVSNASPKALAEREQTVSKPLAESDILGLIGKEKKLLFFIFQKCVSLGSLETQIVTTEELLSFLDVSSIRLRNLIFRLQYEKQLLKVTQVHLGRSGWRKFSLEKEVFQIIRLHLSSDKALAEREQSVSNASPKALAYPLAEPSRQTDRGLVSQFENEENSFPKKETKEKLSTLSNSAKRQTTWNFANLDFSAVHPINLTIVNVAIQRDAEMTLTQEVVQDFINRFATYLSFQNAKKIQNSCGLFCSELKKLINPSENGRTQVLDFETEAERKINAEMAQKIIKIQMENELVEKARELSSDKEKFESEKEVWMQKVRNSSQGISLSEEIIYITAFGSWKEAQQK